MSNTTQAKAEVTAGAIIDRFIKLRDRKAEIKKEYEKKVEVIDQAMDRCEAFLLNLLNAQGSESIKSSEGTAYIQTKTSITVADRDEFLGYVREHGEWSMLDVRANKTTIDEYRKEKNDLPPGLNYNAIRVVGVRRS